MTARDYKALAAITGNALLAARQQYGDEGYRLIYDALYEPITALLESDNPRFDRERFAFAVGQLAYNNN